MPYSFSAFGVLPPLWSRAAMKPSAFFTLLNCCSFMGSTLSSSVAGGHATLWSAWHLQETAAPSGWPFLPDCGRVFVRRGVVGVASDAGSIGVDHCANRSHPYGDAATVGGDDPRHRFPTCGGGRVCNHSRLGVGYQRALVATEGLRCHVAARGARDDPHQRLRTAPQRGRGRLV